MRGRKPKLEVIEGGASISGAPAWLPPLAKAEWNRVAPVLASRKVLTDGDLSTLEQYCLTVGMVRRSQAQIAEDGELIVTEKGARRHPAFQTMFQALTEGRRLAAELGLTPASRNKAPSTKGGDDDDLADMGI